MKRMLFCLAIAAVLNAPAAHAYDHYYGYYGYYSPPAESFKYDTKAPVQGYALAPGQQFEQSQKMLNYQAPGQQNVNYLQGQVRESTAASQGYYAPSQQQQNLQMMNQIYSDPYHAQMEGKVRQLNLAETDRAIKNSARSDRADGRAETRDKMYTTREGFRTVNSVVDTASGVVGFVRLFR